MSDVKIGVFEKPAPVEKDSELLATIDALIDLEKSGTLKDGQKPYAEVEVEDERAARKFMYEMQKGAKQRDKGFRRTRYEVLDVKGKPVPSLAADAPESDHEARAKVIAKVIVGGALGKRHQAKSKDEA